MEKIEKIMSGSSVALGENGGIGGFIEGRGKECRNHFFASYRITRKGTRHYDGQIRIILSLKKPC